MTSVLSCHNWHSVDTVTEELFSFLAKSQRKIEQFKWPSRPFRNSSNKFAGQKNNIYPRFGEVGFRGPEKKNIFLETFSLSNLVLGELIFCCLKLISHFCFLDIKFCSNSVMCSNFRIEIRFTHVSVWSRDKSTLFTLPYFVWFVILSVLSWSWPGTR